MNRQEAREKAAQIIKRRLMEWNLVLTMENVRRVFGLVWQQIPDEDVVKAVYRLIEKDWTGEK